MATQPYGFNDGYTEGTPPSARDLKRRARVVASQLPGAFSALGAGVLYSYLTDAPEDSLLVSGASGAYTVGEGEALVRASGGHLVYARVAASQIVVLSEEKPFAHLVLQTGNGTSISSEEGAPALVVASEGEELSGALLLAQLQDDGTLLDKREFNRLSELVRQTAQIQADLGYNAEQREEGTVAERLDAVETALDEAGTGTGGGGTGTGTGGEVTLLMFRSLQAQFQEQARELAALRAKLGQDAPLSVRTLGRLETLRAEHSRLALSVTRNSPRTGQRLQSSVVLPGLAGLEESTVDGQKKPARYVGGNLIVDRANRRLI